MVTTESALERLAALRLAAAAVPDPEIPVLTIADLGILRDVRFAADGRPEVVLTPTYSGCPATEAIRADVLAQTREVDPQTRVVIELAPAWTTDWITDEGKAKLRDYGIAPPRPTRAGPVPVQLGSRPAVRPAATDAARCPRCDSADTELISQFGSTPCKSLRRCRSCAEPFDEFKSL
ncbi:1,2-phenylacetyl-CoA epoxidase subunit PaaD [Jatrophihabitans sp.]|uniref:1,2-phenylacetyl-CoA epoxidase subunit PaaD n=1 Tax=Jatrophihabitans sp. TaxID=1932789 RepID=UPI002C0DC177|nr:1,2-phenylacetyl-CoA epoxidase subunit PaaD [Jatrophihabitans sp.]